ncbi:hypothetical protein JCM16303_001708 [Sporobolomyces ruberrimus]
MLSVRLPALIALRAIRPSIVLPSLVRPISSPQSTRLLSTTPSLLSSTTAETTSLASSAGSGKGGRAEKEAARKAKEQARKDKEKERARKEKEKVKLHKEREKVKAHKEKEKEKLKKEKEKSKLEQKVKDSKPKTRSTLHPPKAPTTSWGMFLGDFINERKRSLGPGEKIGSLSELTKTAGQEYSQLDSSSKSELQRRADEERAAYPAILEAWKAKLTPEMIREENTVRTNRRKLGLSRKSNLKIEGEPKRPKTAYFFFLTEQREKGPDSEVLQGETRILEQSKLVAAAWRALSDSEKQHYNELYNQDKARYEEEKKEWDAKLSTTKTTA